MIAWSRRAAAAAAGEGRARRRRPPSATRRCFRCSTNPGLFCASLLLQVLSKLLPIVIGKLGAGAGPALQKKVLDILSHVNKRTRALPALRLPLHELAAVYTGGQAGV